MGGIVAHHESLSVFLSKYYHDELINLEKARPSITISTEFFPLLGDLFLFADFLVISNVRKTENGSNQPSADFSETFQLQNDSGRLN
jgi:hypothetical protein